MATRSYIGVQEDNGISAVYCHYDGYPEFVGKELLNYTTLSDVQELISYGDRSSLTGPFYKDRGEQGCEPAIHRLPNDFIAAADDCGAEYYYLFRDGIWYMGTLYGNGKHYRTFTPLTDIIGELQ